MDTNDRPAFSNGPWSYLLGIMVTTGANTFRLNSVMNAWVNHASNNSDIIVQFYGEYTTYSPFNVYGVGRCPSWMHCPSKLVSSTNMWKMWRHMYAKKTQFLFKCDDDTLVSVENLLHLVKGLSSIPSVYGECHNKQTYCSGGAGYLMHASLVFKLLSGKCRVHLAEDVELSRCAVKYGAKLINVDGFSSNLHCQHSNRVTSLIESHWITVHPFRSHWVDYWKLHSNESQKYTAQVVSNHVINECGNRRLQDAPLTMSFTAGTR